MIHRLDCFRAFSAAIVFDTHYLGPVGQGFYIARLWALACWD